MNGKRRKRRALRIGIIVVAGTLLVLPLAAVLYLKFADLSGHAVRVERIVSDAIGRELRIEGEFEPEIGWTSTLRATKVSLANPDWSSEPTAVYVERLTASVDLASILSGPIRLHDIRVDGARVLVEIAEDGRDNWTFDIDAGDGAKTDESAQLGVTFDAIGLRDVELVIDDAGWERPQVVQVDRIDASLVDPQTLDVDLGARYAGRPLALTGRISSVDLLIQAGPVTHDLSGRIGSDRVAFRGSLDDLATLRGPDLALQVDGPEICALTEPLGLPLLGQGAYELDVRTSPAGARVEVALDALTDRLDVDARGRIDSLLAPGEFDLSISASGANLQAVGALVGLEGMPETPFAVSGRLAREDGQTSFHELEAELGDVSLSVDGTLGSLSEMSGTELRFEGSGPDLSVIDGLVGLELPAQPFEARGRLSRQSRGLVLEDVHARVGRTDVELSGTIGAAPDYAGTDLVVVLDGPDLSVFDRTSGVELPAAPFRVCGHGVYGGAGIVLDSTTARLGDNELRIDGTVVAVAGLVGSDLRLRMQGPDLAQIGRLAGRDGLPAEPFEAGGRVRVLSDGYRLEGIEAELGDVELSLDGRLGPVPELAGTDLRIRASGPDLSVPAGLAGMSGLPGEPFRVAGTLRASDDGYELEGVSAHLGRIELEADGRVGPLPDLTGTALRFSIATERLDTLGAFIGNAPKLPEEPFAAAGGFGVEPDGFALNEVEGRLGSAEFRVNGRLGPLPEVAGSEIEFEVSGPELGAVERMLASVDLAERLGTSEASFSVSGKVRATTSGYEIEELLARVGGDEVRLRGAVGPEPSFVGTDLLVEGTGVDGSWIGDLLLLPLPQEPYRVRGRAERLESGFRFGDLQTEFGEYRFEIDGTLGDPPRFEGTFIDVSAAGPDLDLIRSFADLPAGIDGRFSFSGHAEGTPEEFTVQPLRIELGESDLAGSIRVDLRDKPFIHADLASDYLDMAALLGPSIVEPDPTEPAPTTPDAPAEESEQRSSGEGKKRLRISDEPFDFEALDVLNLDLDLSVKRVASRRSHVNEFELGLDLEDGRLSLDPFDGVGDKGAKLAGSLLFAPVPEGHDLRIRLQAEHGKPDVLGHGDDPALWPEVALELDLAGTGASPHEVAGSLDGWTTIWIGEGRVDNSVLGLITADVFLTILEALNPFAEQEEFVLMECGVVHLEVTDGVARLDPMALRTDRMTVVGNGRVRLSSEQIDLRWAAKPRKGVGLSASTLTNPYVKLGGTLSDPSLEIKPIEAVASTGAAVATLGLSVLARGMYDRATAERKVCDRGLEQIEKIEARRAESPDPAP